ncbi:beta-ketoacyl-ACP synthase II [Legionella maioricensis]|uniref:3-oxoacyl-[acyl-carrier-protein] synthase 2 n=1 Tax=Legionella maioricensis TaxID=2896528 RepID=A0A9X2IBK4_9GAMM|nr:beta-ketoacyl-ACP synthase II [Legionella maioricensis]MCL9684994.1 beta-ketoacyl-ACP synthase II [Legionella maioricensis]MCL9688109.1 beta-ketoacyl-ACP synthase II [Legionella maioricensis]
MNSFKKRVVITGIGAITPIGITLEEIEKSLRESLSGIKLITHFDTEKIPVKFAGEASQFKPEMFLEAKEIRRNDRFIHMCLAASDMAVYDSGISSERLHDAGVAIGVGLGGLYTIEEATLEMNHSGAKRVSPFLIPSILANLASGQVSIRYRTKGANYAISSACASGSQAIGQAYREIQSGRRDIWIAGGSEAPITPLSIAGFSAARALSRRNEEPVLASRPFDEDREGFVLGEGAAVFILESLDSAQQRNAKIYAEIVGFGIASDGYHVTEPEPNGEGAYLAMKEALVDSSLDVAQIDYVNAHATSTMLGDKIEAIAMERIFGEQMASTFVSSTKSLTGHACGAAGALETAFCSLMLVKDFLPPAFNLDKISPEFRFKSPGQTELNFHPNIIMNNSFGFGGVNTSMLLKRMES